PSDFLATAPGAADRISAAERRAVRARHRAVLVARRAWGWAAAAGPRVVTNAPGAAAAEAGPLFGLRRTMLLRCVAYFLLGFTCPFPRAPRAVLRCCVNNVWMFDAVARKLPVSTA